jgi:uncharacterized membrane-anchored protein YitT (DUF2179 family)
MTIKKIRALRVVWAAMWVVFALFVLLGLFGMRQKPQLDEVLTCAVIGALVSAVGFSIIYIQTGSVALPQLPDRED